MENEPSELALPAWRVKVYALAISRPMVAARVGWLPSDAHPEKVFKTRRAAEKHAAWVEGRAKWSLIPIQWRGEIIEETRAPDFWDKFKAWLTALRGEA